MQSAFRRDSSRSSRRGGCEANSAVGMAAQPGRKIATTPAIGPVVLSEDMEWADCKSSLLKRLKPHRDSSGGHSAGQAEPDTIRVTRSVSSTDFRADVLTSGCSTAKFSQPPCREPSARVAVPAPHFVEIAAVRTGTAGAGGMRGASAKCRVPSAECVNTTDFRHSALDTWHLYHSAPWHPAVFRDHHPIGRDAGEGDCPPGAVGLVESVETMTPE